MGVDDIIIIIGTDRVREASSFCHFKNNIINLYNDSNSVCVFCMLPNIHFISQGVECRDSSLQS